jgi:hypothetical protein
VRCGVTLGVEGVVDGGMNRQEAPSWPGRLEPVHLELASLHRLAPILGSVVSAQPFLMGTIHAIVGVTVPSAEKLNAES